MNLASIAWPAPRTLVLAAVGTLALVLAIGGGWLWYSVHQERAQAIHAEALAQSNAVRGPQTTPTPETTAAAMRALESALAQSPDAALAAQSAYELANLRFDAGQFAAARAAYGVALAKASSATIRTLARGGIAAAWEAERDFTKAIAAYTAALAEEKPGQFYFEDLLLGLGRSQELAGRRDDAVRTYQRLLKEVPKLRRESEVRARLASLGVAG